MTSQLFNILVESTPHSIERVGPLILGSWSRHDDELGRSMQGDFLLDTGAYGAMIDLDVASSLLLADRGTRDVHGIHGYGSLPQYLARLSLPAKDDDGKDCTFEQVIECVGVRGLTVKSCENGAQVIGILGRLFLRSARLVVDGRSGRISLHIQRFSGS